MCEWRIPLDDVIGFRLDFQEQEFLHADRVHEDYALRVFGFCLTLFIVF